MDYNAAQPWGILYLSDVDKIGGMRQHPRDVCEKFDEKLPAWDIHRFVRLASCFLPAMRMASSDKLRENSP